MLSKTLLVCLGLATTASAASLGPAKRWNKNPNKPNIVYIVADDQDAATATPEIMPLLYEHIAKAGVNYTNFYAPVSQCCPSRVGFLRGQLGHSHNITSVTAPLGGYETYCKFGYNGDHLFNWLQDAGYATYYTGKLMNGNTVANAVHLPVNGLNHSAVLLDPFTYSYRNASYSIDGGPPQQYPGVYSTDWIRDHSLGYLEDAAKSGEPFFVGIAPIGPHSQGASGPDWVPPLWAKRHDGLFEDAVAPRLSSFNPDEPSGVSWVSQLAKLNQTEVDFIDVYYRARLRALQANDELVAAVVKKVEELGLLDNTYIMMTSDNGFTLGAHRRHPGKTTGYEEDIRVPFLVRGPGIEHGKDELSAHSNIDITATIVHLTGAEPQHELDGRIMPWANKGAKKTEVGTVDFALQEFWVAGGGEGKFSSSPNFTIPTNFAANANYPNNTYRMLRVIEENHNLAYAVWCQGSRELYDMQTDQHQMHNLLADSNKEGPNAPLRTDTEAGRLATRLDALMLYLKFCKGIRCRYSWKNIAPYGDFTSLDEAMDPKYDSYFEGLPRVRYDNCKFGFYLENEFPYWTTDLAYFDDPMERNSTSEGGKMVRRQWDWTGMGEWSGDVSM